MPIQTGQNADPADFINKSERNATSSNDAGRVAKMEADGYQSEDHMEAAGAVDITVGEEVAGGTTPQPVYISDVDSKAYLADANDTSKMKFVGFVTDSAIANGTSRLAVSGLVRGFSGLSAGEKYYLSDTAGAMSTSPGTNEVLVGIAVSATCLLVLKGKRFASGVASFSASGTSAITLGFRPSKIRIHACLDANADLNRSSGGWDAASGNKCLTSKNGTGNTASSLAWDLLNGGSNGHHGTITSITDTGFTLSNTEVGNATTIHIYWQAEGEL